SARLGHLHRVNVCFTKQTSWYWDCGQDMKLVHLLCLTLVTRFNVPLDVLDDMRPPKVKHKAHTCGIDAFMS
ncbi:hypothetical protein CY34DRAFT_98057, partial [Suillus luteus UH-Slu-Lm8-n1]